MPSADFIKVNVTYDENTEHLFLLNIVAFNINTLEWMVVARVQLSCETAEAYKIAFQNVFRTCKCNRHDFSPSEQIKGIVIDWSQAEMKGLKLALGEEVASQHLRDCQVHWIRSCQRICDRVISTTGKHKEQAIFRTLSSAITSLHNQSKIVAFFQALCSALPITEVIQKVPSISISHDEVAWVDANCDWSCTSHWAQWWSKPEHLKMLCAPLCKYGYGFLAALPHHNKCSRKKECTMQGESANSN